MLVLNIFSGGRVGRFRRLTRRLGLKPCLLRVFTRSLIIEGYWDRWQGITLVRWCRHVGGDRGPFVQAQKVGVVMKRRNVGGGGSGAPRRTVVTTTSKVFAKFPGLIEHCCVVMYEDGSPRKPGWLTIQVWGGAWCVRVKDPDAAASLTVTAALLDDALVLAEAMVDAPEAPWEHDSFLASSKPAKKKS
jgi:hypothetical protein